MTYRCSQCKTTYSSREYYDLDKVLIDEDHPRMGYERVCECGARFHTEKWRRSYEIDTGKRAICVTTRALIQPHGANDDQWYETMVEWGGGDYILARYSSQSEAERHHERVIDALETGDYHIQDRQPSEFGLGAAQ